MEEVGKTSSIVDQLTSDEELSPRGGVGGNEHCVAVLSRKARILYIFKAKRKLR